MDLDGFAPGRIPGRVTVVPALSDGVIVLNGYTDSDIAAHLAGEDEEIARHFGPWPQASTEATVRDPFTRWSHGWKTGGPTRAFAAARQQPGGSSADASCACSAMDRLTCPAGPPAASGAAATQPEPWPCSCSTHCPSGSPGLNHTRRRRQPRLPAGVGEGRLPPGQQIHRRQHRHNPVQVRRKTSRARQGSRSPAQGPSRARRQRPADVDQQ